MTRVYRQARAREHSAALASRRRSAGAEGLVPPHSVEAEQSVLGALLIDKTAWDQVADVVTTEDFYRPDHRLIFEALGELVAAGHGRRTS